MLQTHRSNNMWLKVMLAFAFWTGMGLLFSTQIYFLTPNGSWLEAMGTAMPRWYAWGLLSPLIFIADRRLLRHRPLLWRMLLHLPLGLLFVFAVETIRYTAAVALPVVTPDHALTFFVRGMYWDILIYGLIVGVYLAWDATTEAQRRQLRETQLQNHLTEAQLHALQTQLHPHFLFNALNTISAYTETEPRVARRMMAQLGELLRASLDHTAIHKISLVDELVFLENYLAIERIRFEGRLTVDIQIEQDVRDALVPSFILQPLVENAIRHGINAQMRGGNILITAHRSAQQCMLSVADDGAGLPADWHFEDHAGVGLRNTAQRLEKLYGKAHNFNIIGAPGEGVRVDISLPFQIASKNGYSVEPALEANAV